MNLSDFLYQLGLQEVEQDIFLTCTRFPYSSIATIARITKKPRSTIHDTVKKMVEEWLLLQREQSRWFAYSALSYEWLQWLLTDKKQHIAKQLVSLESVKQDLSALQLYNHWFSTIEHYTWPHVVNLIYSKITDSSVVKAVFHPTNSLLHSNYMVEELVELIANNTKESREIICDDNNGQKYARLMAWHIKHDVKLLSEHDMEQFNADYLITDDAFYFIALAEEIVGIEIRNPIFVQAQHMMFDQLWNRL